MTFYGIICQIQEYRLIIINFEANKNLAEFGEGAVGLMAL